MNQVNIIGTMTKDVEIRYGVNGNAFGGFTIAYNERYRNQAGETIDKPNFFKVNVFGKTIETINQYFHKGSRIGVTGSLQHEMWETNGEKRSNVTIKLEKFYFIDKKGDAQPQHQPQPQQQYQQQPQADQHPEINIDDELPF